MSDRELRNELVDVLRRLRRRARPRRGPGSVRPVLTVVIPVYNVEAYLAECLDSVLAQTFRELEVVAVDDGSTDSSPQILAEYAARDRRLRVLTQKNSGQGIARNAAVAIARGEFLTFCDSDDVVPPWAYGHMVETLRRTGSDFCVGAVRRFTHQRFFGISWAAVHDHDRLGTTIDEYPDAMQDIIACNRVFRTAFWRERVPPFRGHIAYEDHVPMLAAYVRAARFDVLARVTYRWRIREDNTSTGQQKANIENLLDRIAVKEEAHVLLREEASVTAYDAWVARTIDIDFQPFIEPALAAGDMYRNVLSAACLTMLDRATAPALEQVRFISKVRAWLCAHGEWAAIVATDDYFRTEGRIPAVHVEQERLVADPADDAPFRDLVPQHLWGLARRETGLVAGLRSVLWEDDRMLRLAGYAVVRGLGSVGDPPVIEAWLDEKDSGAVITLPVRVATDHRVNDVVRSTPHADYLESGFEIVVDIARLRTASSPEPTSWSLRLRLRQGDVVREGGVHGAVDGSAALRPRPRVVQEPHGALLVKPVLGDEGWKLVVSEVAVTAEPGRPGPGTVTGRLLGDVHEVALQRHPGGRRVAGEVTAEGRFEITAATEADRPFERAELLARRTGGPDVPVSPAGEEPDGLPGDVDAAWTMNADGTLEIVTDARRAAVRDIRLDPAAVTFELDATALGRHDVRTAALVSGDLRLEATEIQREGNQLRIHFPRRLDRWRTGAPSALPTGEYSLVVTLADGTEPPVEPTGELVGRLPAVEIDGDLRINVRMRRTGRLRVAVAPPLSEVEQTPRGQQQLRDGYRRASGSADGVPEASVLLMSSLGWQADGHPLALDRALARSRPDLARYWAVRSQEVAVPEGAVPVVIGSPGWYDVLRSSRYLCVDDEVDPAFEKRPHQRLLQTFRGRPFKSMGRTRWQQEGLSETRILVETARRRREWDAILVPDRESAEVYRREFDYAGATIAAGSPRYDLILGAHRDSVRRRVLDGLGVPAESTVVLYAPTFRDALSRRVSSAGLFPGLELDRLARALGPGHVVLLRAHPLDRLDAPRAVQGTTVVNVTDHPDLAGLLVAADAAVLDYSSLRFDWALTGRPAIYFVPDREQYLRIRPPLFDYDETVAGPQVTSTDQVVERLRDLGGLAEEHRRAVSDLNRRFSSGEDGAAADRVVAEFFTS